MRTLGSDDLRQLETFGTFAKWDPDWLSDVPWAPTPTRFEYLGDAGRLDVAMHATMTRADFDRCARGLPDGGGCAAFPLSLGKAGYAVRPELTGLKSLVVDPKAKAAWAADAGRISYTVGLSGEPDRFIREGPSLLRGFQLWTSEPAKAAEAVAQVKADGEKRASGAEWADPVCTDVPWCGLRTEALNRDRSRLVYRYLQARTNEAGYGLRGPPPNTIDYLGSTFIPLVPKDALPAADDLKLRIVYDVSLAEFRENGTARAPWNLVCRPDTMKKPSLKEFCGRLGVGAGKPARSPP